MSVPLSPSELHSLFADLDLTPRARDSSARPAAEVNRQWLGSDIGQGGAHPLWMLDGIEEWLKEFRARLRDTFSQTHQPIWDALPQAATAIRLHHFVQTHRVRQGFRCDFVIPGTPLWMIFDPHLVAVQLDLALGATESLASAVTPVQRPLTLGPLETRIMCRCVSNICDALVHAAVPSNFWENHIESLSEDESWITGIPFNLATTLAVLEFRLVMGEHTGNLTIASTREALQSLIPQRGLGADRFVELPAGQGASESRAAKSTLQVVLARATLSSQELAGLQVGDVVLTSQEANAPCEVWVDGILRFEAMAATFQDHKAVRLGQKTELDPID